MSWFARDPVPRPAARRAPRLAACVVLAGAALCGSAWGTAVAATGTAASAPASSAATAPPAAASAPAATRTQALRALAATDAATRLAALERLAELGTMADAPRVARHLRAADGSERAVAELALWAIWSRSGDAGIDQLLARGSRLMHEGDLAAALALFDEIVRLRPAFAEGWNKRATVLFLLRRNAESLRDCDEVLKRNPLHFGALSGMAQLHLRRGDPEAALQAYERALAVNPNLAGGAGNLRALEEAVRKKRRAAGERRT